MSDASRPAGRVPATASDAYDELPYTEHAYAETHPSRVAAVARLSGWSAPAVEDARILELGCGRGGNLLPLAAGLPRATCVGVDRSERQIESARRVAAETGLGNVTFVRAAFDEMDLAPGSFDYVICHGVLSWIPAPARSLLLSRIAWALSPSGVAHVSFNVLPGWYERMAARDWLRFAASALDADTISGATSVRWLREQVSPEHPGYGRSLESVAARLAETDPAYAQHEFLAEENHALLVGTFLGEASAAGLSYLGDAIPQTTALELVAEEVRERAAGLDAAQVQQLVDFVRCTSFRRSLLVRQDEARVRSWSPRRDLDRSAILSLHVASRLRPEQTQGDGPRSGTFLDGDQAVQINDLVLRRALRALAATGPSPLPFDELARRTTGLPASARPSQTLAGELFDLWLAASGIDLLASAPSVAAEVGNRPTACPVARWRAVHGGPITNRLHQEVLVPEAIVRWILSRLDGTRTRDDLAREARSFEGAGTVTDAELERLVAAGLDRLAACALLVPDVAG